MSGGSYDYAYCKIEDLADAIQPLTPLRKAFKEHLRKVSKACYDIELVDSGDKSGGDEDAAILACLGESGPTLALAEAVKDAVKVRDELDAAIRTANTMISDSEERKEA